MYIWYINLLVERVCRHSRHTFRRHQYGPSIDLCAQSAYTTTWHERVSARVFCRADDPSRAIRINSTNDDRVMDVVSVLTTRSPYTLGYPHTLICTHTHTHTYTRVIIILLFPVCGVTAVRIRGVGYEEVLCDRACMVWCVYSDFVQTAVFFVKFYFYNYKSKGANRWYNLRSLCVMRCVGAAKKKIRIDLDIFSFSRSAYLTFLKFGAPKIQSLPSVFFYVSNVYYLSVPM